MDKPFFIMIYSQRHNHAMPIVDDEEEVIFFESEDAAHEAIKGNVYAETFGYEVFEMGTGA